RYHAMECALWRRVTRIVSASPRTAENEQRIAAVAFRFSSTEAARAPARTLRAHAAHGPIRPSDVVALRRAWLAARWSASTTRGNQSRFVVLKIMEGSDIRRVAFVG